MRSKRLILIILMALGFAATASAQYPRAFGIRGGYGLEVSYQHFLGDPHFLEVDLGLDLVGERGFKVTGSYDFVIARPNITRGGDWSIYLGPGLSAGYVYNKDAEDASFMVAGCLVLGMEFAPWRHFGISLDFRPMYGWDFGGKKPYLGGLYSGLIPSLGVRFLF